MFIAASGLTNFRYKLISYFFTFNYFIWCYLVVKGFNNVSFKQILKYEKYILIFVIISYIWENMWNSEIWSTDYTREEVEIATKLAKEEMEHDANKKCTLKDAKRSIFVLNLFILLFAFFKLKYYDFNFIIKMLTASFTYYIICIGLYKIKILK